MVTLEKTDWTMPETLPVGTTSDVIKPFRAGEIMRWKFIG
jgi:dihydroorotase